ncbi:formyltransferase family protein [Aestuariivirga sp.]|jgi:methionyl-tRNA formyltransferase|uniref:formyltransferase family protein n=1 Tax=Aestuariivirga sp. TaxID=2650926 RepID=UPI0037847A40
MKIDLLCSSRHHPVIPWLETWRDQQTPGDETTLLHEVEKLGGGDVLFLISCSEIIPAERRALYGHVIVLHASDLPRGRGWSPHVWAIIEGAHTLTVSAIDAAEKVDSGDVWSKRTFEVAPHALHEEINAALFANELKLMDEVIGMIRQGRIPVPQPEVTASYYRRRIPADSEIDPGKSIAEQFDILRVCDPERYPAFFHLHGHVYEIRLKKLK